MYGFNKINEHPIIVILGISLLIYGLINIFEIKPLEKENINLQMKLNNYQNNIKSSQEYLNQRDKLINAELQIKNYEDKVKSYNELLKETSYLKLEKEKLKKENEKYKNNNYSFNETCKEELDELQYEYKIGSDNLNSISYSNNKEQIEAHKTIVNGLKEQINSLLSSKCFSK